MSQTKAQLLQGTAAENVTVDNIVTTSVNGGQLSHRNRIINAAMLVNQRASSYTATGEYYVLDRFEKRTGSGFTFDATTTQDSSAPDGFTKSLKITPDSTETPTGSHNAIIGQKIEADNLIGFASGTSSAKKFVLSFYAKSASQNNGHQYSVQLSKLKSDGNRYYQNASFTVTSSWQRFTVAFPADTVHNITTGNGEGIRILWHLAAGPDDIASQVTSWTLGGGNYAVTGQSNFMDNTSNEFYLTGVQLEASDSDVATDFEHRSFGEELSLCQRFYQRWKGHSDHNGIGAGRGNGTSGVFVGVNLIKCLRAAPSVTNSGIVVFRAGTSSTSTSDTPSLTNASAFDANMCSFPINITGLSGINNNQGGYTVFLSGSDLQLDAEL